MKDAPMTVIETQSFLRTAKALVSDEERMDLIAYLAENPTAGDIMEGTGGVRKVRWARRGGGKSGGFRVIYYYYSEVILSLIHISVILSKTIGYNNHIDLLI